LATSGVPTDENNRYGITEKKTDPNNDEYTEETVPMKPSVTYSQAQDAVQNFMNIFENSEAADNSTSNALSVIKQNLRDIKVKSMKQVSIPN
jgi:hypothetical protein